MITSAQRIARTQLGTFTVILVTLVLGLLQAAWAYWIGKPDPGYGRDFILKIGLLVTLGVAICNLVAFLLTMPLYFWLRLPLTRKRMVIHSIVSTLICTVSLCLGVPVWLIEPFREFESGLAPLVVATILVFIIPFAASLLAQAFWLRKRKD